MASTLTTAAVASGVQPRAIHAGVNQVTGIYDLAAALVVSDVIQMVKIPKGATIIETLLNCADLDGTSGLELAVGDGSDIDRFITGSTIGQTGGKATLNQVPTSVAGQGYTYTADDTIDVFVTTAPANGTASGRIVLTVEYTMEGVET